MLANVKTKNSQMKIKNINNKYILTVVNEKSKNFLVDGTPEANSQTTQTTATSSDYPRQTVGALRYVICICEGNFVE